MTKRHSTKRALVASILALCMCFTMLIGTTFAWFTDSATSSGNVIKTGTLNVGMYWADGKADPADTATAWTDATTGPIFNSDTWEPGYTEVRHIKIANEGTLALKYKVQIIANGEVSKLSDAIDVYYADPAVQVANASALTADKKLGTLTEALAGLDTTGTGNLDAGKADTITIAFKMQDTAGNEYQGLSIGTDFSIHIIATQNTAETDSFGDQYDIDADYVAEVKTAEALATALQAGGIVKLASDISANDSPLEIPVGVAVELDLNGKTIDGGYQNGSTEKHIYPICNYGTLVLTGNGTVVGRGVANYGDLVVENGTYSAIDTNGGGAIWNYTGSKAVINGGKFIAADDDVAPGATVINVASNSTVVINGGEFVANADQTYAIISSGDLTINNGTISADHGVISSTGTMVLNGGTYIQNGNLPQTSSLLYISGGNATVNGGTYNFNVDGKLDSGLPVYCAAGKVDITGGTFTGYVTDMVDTWGGSGAVTVTGGTFDKSPKFVADGYKVVENSDGTYTVSYDGTVVSTSAELKNALANGGKILLTEDITDAITITVPSGVSTELDLNGNSITSSKLYALRAEGTLVLTGGGKIAGTEGAVFNFGGEVIIDGDFYDSDFYAVTVKGGNIKNCTFDSFEILGGTFDDCTFVDNGFYAGGTFEFNPPAGSLRPYHYTVDNGDGTWTVVADYQAYIGETGYLTFSDAINAAKDGDVIVAAKDIEFIEGCRIDDKNITIDLNYKTLTSTYVGLATDGCVFKVYGNSNVTFKNGTLIGPNGKVATDGTATYVLENVQ
ncbi:MAG: hypothetical protein E7673_04465 [Ruminococcaceae bacterium]|nr:hypothetical protein [Oscillospiraceae bacterium]